ncbi:hypothetical protein, partial [Erythrobacter sp. HI0063]|uniref:hypothetical protein n=1 Tax=Erythrobacter sp. HI0063 TaxID=1822240 RepID=UPI001F3A7AC9
MLTQLAKERENPLGHDIHHLARFEVLEAGPAKIGVRTTLIVVAVRKNSPLHRNAKVGGLVFLKSMQV